MGLNARAESDFLRKETPWQMAGQAAGGLGGAVAGMWIGSTIGASQARSSCRERIDPDFSDECGWSVLGGFLGGAMIGGPIGHALGAGLAGVAQKKRGVLWTMASAVAGDVVIFSGAVALGSAFDGNAGPFLVGVTALAMLAVPVATQSILDYRLRYLVPTAGISPGGGVRAGLVLAEARF